MLRSLRLHGKTRHIFQHLFLLRENKNPTLCVPGNIDQAQYCERIKGIIELLGSKLSLDELSKIWRIQVSGTVITNTLVVVTPWCGPPASDFISICRGKPACNGTIQDVTLQ